jgi:hypothetical protein
VIRSNATSAFAAERQVVRRTENQMSLLVRTGLVVAALLLPGASGLRAAELDQGKLLDGKEWQALGLVTGFHSVRIKKPGLEARLIEADGSASVAENPVALYLVVTNNGTSDLVERIWRLPRGVARVKRLSTSDCGVDVSVDVDRFVDGVASGTSPKTLRLCFLSAGKLDPTLKVSEARR